MIFIFFFQAEDGIRDIGVTGVQTCALPISHVGLEQARAGDDERQPGVKERQGVEGQRERSEERRVGKEWIAFTLRVRSRNTKVLAYAVQNVSQQLRAEGIMKCIMVKKVLLI